MNPDPKPPLPIMLENCNQCQKPFTKFKGAMTPSYVCLRCGLWGDMLRRAYSKICLTDDLKEFNRQLNHWYPVEV